ncbi:MAG: RluA family pseudouridine synthase [Planctomycetia bacterium]|nr:RluA family pseudouridine synthase [Planctomycetia bacterium]
MAPPLPPLQILFEDNHCLAIYKPAGYLTTGYEGGEETLDRQVKAYLKEKFNKPGNVFLGVVHRLDRPVSGVLMYARNSKAAGRLAEQFRESEVDKVYWAVVEGKVEPQKGTWENWLWKDTMQGKVQTVKFGTPGAKLARLDFHCKAADEKHTWIELHPRTGRTHQLRVQLASRGYPIVGDDKYGSTEKFPNGIALHARALTFKHPISYEPMTLTAPLPASWKGFRSLGLEAA